MAYDVLPVDPGVTQYNSARDQHIQAGIEAAATTADAALVKSQNLADLPSATAARAALGLGTAATRSPAQLSADTSFAVQSVARRVLSASHGTGVEAPLSPLSATVVPAMSAVNAATSISGGVRIAPKLLSSTVVDTAGDPHFEYVGAIPGRLKVQSGDKTFPDALTGGASQTALNFPRYRFHWVGQAIEFIARMRVTPFKYRVWVDGLALAVDQVSTAVTVSGTYLFKLDFGSVGPHLIEIEASNIEFGGVWIEPTASISRPQSALLLAGFGDSHVRGAGGVDWPDTFVRRAANILRVDWANVGIGGSGYLNDNGTTGGNYRNRLTTDIVPLAPDILWFEGSWNDAASTPAALGAEALYCFQTLKAALPNTLLIAAGPWVVGHAVNATLDSFDAQLQAQAQAAGWHGYVSYRDPLKQKAVTAAWAASTAYIVGQAVLYNGFVQTCVTGHTSSASFDQTKWRSTAIVTGSGKVGTTVGDGSADVIVQSDGIHATAVGHQVKARYAAQEVLRIARSIAAGNTWAA